MSLSRRTVVVRIAFLMFALLFAGFFAGCNEKPDPNAPPEIYSYSPGEPFLSNTRNPDKYIKCDVVITATSEHAIAVLAEKNYVVRNGIYEVFRSMTEDDLNREDLQTYLSDTIAKKLMDDLGIRTIDRIYFNDLLTQ